MAEKKTTSPKVLQIVGVDKETQRKFRVYAVAHDLSQAEAFNKAVLALLDSEK